MQTPLLWTGGWDSTFRLLQLLRTTDAVIQPLYLVDEGRGSTPRELDTIRRLRGALAPLFPDLASRLLPTEYGSFRATRITPTIDAQWTALKEAGYRVGLQYPVLATYAEQHDIDGFELSIEAHAPAVASSVTSLLDAKVVRRPGPAGPVWRLPASTNGPLALFRRFSFPLIHYTKHDMEQAARRYGLAPLLYETWFCFNPILGRPCGRCHPCRTAQNDGFRHRVGRLGPFLSTLQSKAHGVRARGKSLWKRLRP